MSALTQGAPPKDIRVLIADDSMFMRYLLRRVLEESPRILVVGEARDGAEAVERNVELEPHVILMDVEMPRLDGIGALAEIMATRPIPVVMFSSLTTHGAQVTMDALALGAIDFLPKPESRVNITPVGDELRRKVIVASSARVIKQSKRKARRPRPERQSKQSEEQCAEQSSESSSEREGSLVLIGSSTGGPQALDEVLPGLPGDLKSSVLVCQHMPPGFTASLAKRLDALAALSIREAADGDALKAGTVLIAPGGYHTRLTAAEEGGSLPTVRLDTGEPVHGVRPAIDVTLADAVPLFGKRLMVVILTGMGFDGARGARAAKNLGATVVCQDEKTSVVWGMPKACIELGACDEVLPLQEIAGAVERFADRMEEEA